jgi:hypothetical protein
MADIEPNLDSPELQPTRPATTFIIAAIVVVAICVSAWFLFHSAVPKTGALVGTTIKLNMSTAEREYVDKLMLKDVTLSRAENFLHQEVTVLNGTIVNTGPGTVTALDVSIRFSDSMNQVVLRETRSVLGTPATPLVPGQQREFELSFEHVPPSWDMQVPSLRLVNLTLSSK